MNHARIALAGVVSVAFIAALYVTKAPAPPAAVIPLPPTRPVASEQDRAAAVTALKAASAPRIVPIERIVPRDPVPTEGPKPLIVYDPPPPPAARKTAKTDDDICRRHGMRKVITGKRWRCKR